MGGMGFDVGSGEAVSALEWWLEAGVDVLVDERPRNWLEKTAPAAEPAKPDSQRPAEEIPGTLAAFREWLAQSPDAPLGGTRSKPVMPTGKEAAEIMLLADAPGREEVTGAMPIAGDAWELTRRMLAAIGFTADQAYVANLACFHAPGAKPSREQLKEWGSVARRHVALARPRRLLVFGDAASLALTGKPVPQARGRVHDINGIRTVVTFHPRFLLDHPAQKALAWKDLLLLMEAE